MINDDLHKVCAALEIDEQHTRANKVMGISWDLAVKLIDQRDALLSDNKSLRDEVARVQSNIKVTLETNCPKDLREKLNLRPELDIAVILCRLCDHVERRERNYHLIRASWNSDSNRRDAYEQQLRSQISELRDRFANSQKVDANGR